MARSAGWLERARRVWLGAATVLLMAACGGPQYVDDQRLEQIIRDGMQAQAQLTVIGVSCPDQHPLQEGDVFECTADIADGRHVTITVRQNGPSGTLSWRITGGS